MFVKTQIGDQSLELLIFLLKLLKASQLSYAHASKLAAPAVERLLANAHLPAGLRGRSCRPQPGAARSQFARR